MRVYGHWYASTRKPVARIRTTWSTWLEIWLNQKPSPQALDGIETLFLLSPLSSTQVEMEQNLISAAVAHRVQRIVKLSAMGASIEVPLTFGRIHGEGEDAIRASGLGWTFVRPSMFMQNLRWYKGAISQGMLPLPLGNAAVSHVDPEDVAAVGEGATQRQARDEDLHCYWAGGIDR